MSQEMLLVYGTLLQQAQNPMADFLKRHSSFYAKAYFMGQLYDLGSYPGALYDPHSSSPVHGDLLVLTEAARVFSRLDPYEDYDSRYPTESLYLRRLIPVVSTSGEQQAWAYIFNQSVAPYPIIHSGNYTQYLES